MDFEDFLPFILGLLYLFFSQRSGKRKKQKRQNRQSTASTINRKSSEEAAPRGSRTEAVGNEKVREAEKDDSDKDRSSFSKQNQRAQKEEEGASSFVDFFKGLTGTNEEEQASSRDEDPESQRDRKGEGGKAREAVATGGTHDKQLAAALKKPREERTVEEEARVRRQETHSIFSLDEKGPEVEDTSGSGVYRRPSRGRAYRRVKRVKAHPLLQDLQEDPQKAILLSEILQRKG